MKKQAADQQFHDRRYQERKRAEAVRKTASKQANQDSNTQASQGKGPADDNKKV
jgi:hypothetical protein